MRCILHIQQVLQYLFLNCGMAWGREYNELTRLAKYKELRLFLPRLTPGSNVQSKSGANRVFLRMEIGASAYLSGDKC